MTALPHVLSCRTGAVVLGTKLIGFTMHAAAAVGLYIALAPANPGVLVRILGASLVAFHPALVAASMSGMEVPLATLLAALLLLAARRGRAATYGVLSGLALFARPELAVLCGCLPVLLWARRDRTCMWRLLSAGGLGLGVSFAIVALRNWSVSGLPLPATFYAKVGDQEHAILEREWVGFADLLGQSPIIDSSLLMTFIVGMTAWVLAGGRDEADITAAAAFASGLAYCAVSFALVFPLDPTAFYHQRYIMPAVPFLVGSIPLLFASATLRLAPAQQSRALALLAMVLGTSVCVDAPQRFYHLSNDARNIDDVQVAMGRSLARSAPSDVAWVTDAGAVRYFGAPYVVDLLGLNSPQMLGQGAQGFLDALRPNFIEVVPGWSTLGTVSAGSLRSRLFETATEYTVTGFPAMRRHWLVRCEPPGFSGTLDVRTRSFRFTCAP